MITRRILATSTATVYLIAFVVTILAFVLLGGGLWVIGTMH
jgi:hypothetical protein